MTAAASHSFPGGSTSPPTRSDPAGAAPTPGWSTPGCGDDQTRLGPVAPSAAAAEALPLHSGSPDAHEQRQPAAAAPPEAEPTAANAVSAPDPSSRTDNPAARRHTRHRLGVEPPARISLANRQPVFVTLSDISHGGCCIVRKGRLELSNGDAVLLDLWTDDIETKLSIHARVCWCSHQEATSRAGLRFVEANHRLLRQIEAYVQHFHQPRDTSRPEPWRPGQAMTASATPAPPPGQPGTTASGPERSPRGARGTTRPAQRRTLASMPRPAPLTSLDLQRRMRRAHRHEIARIAEETGIHIHTLYSWLRTLRLEGEVNPERPGDPEAWSATDKVSALLQVVGMGAEQRAAYCSRHGLSETQLQRWREAALQANGKPRLILQAEEELQRLQVRDQREIRRLQKELRRRERNASISEELLQVVRKLQILWEQDESG